MRGWGGEVADRHVRFVFSNEPVERLAPLARASGARSPRVRSGPHQTAMRMLTRWLVFAVKLAAAAIVQTRPRRAVPSSVDWSLHP